jgi:hypothetical protein
LENIQKNSIVVVTCAINYWRFTIPLENIKHAKGNEWFGTKVLPPYP